MTELETKKQLLDETLKPLVQALEESDVCPDVLHERRRPSSGPPESLKSELDSLELALKHLHCTATSTLSVTTRLLWLTRSLLALAFAYYLGLIGPNEPPHWLRSITDVLLFQTNRAK